MRLAHVRLHPRHALRTECVVRAVHDDRLLADETIDASWSGLRVPAMGRVRVGDSVQVSLRIPSSRTWVEARGSVSRVCQGRRAGEGARSFCVHLNQMDPLDRVLLSVTLRHRPQVDPRRGAGRDYAETVRRIADETPLV